MLRSPSWPPPPSAFIDAHHSAVCKLGNTWLGEKLAAALNDNETFIVYVLLWCVRCSRLLAQKTQKSSRFAHKQTGGARKGASTLSRHGPASVGQWRRATPPPVPRLRPRSTSQARTGALSNARALLTHAALKKRRLINNVHRMRVIGPANGTVTRGSQARRPSRDARSPPRSANAADAVAIAVTDSLRSRKSLTSAPPA
ncbi:hypothetical protein ACJJTC_002222 [Scirpophaga incertulas]